MQHGVEVQVEDMSVKKDPDGGESQQQGLEVVRPRIGTTCERTERTEFC